MKTTELISYKEFDPISTNYKYVRVKIYPDGKIMVIPCKRIPKFFKEGTYSHISSVGDTYNYFYSEITDYQTRIYLFYLNLYNEAQRKIEESRKMIDYVKKIFEENNYFQQIDRREK